MLTHRIKKNIKQKLDNTQKTLLYIVKDILENLFCRHGPEVPKYSVGMGPRSDI